MDQAAYEAFQKMPHLGSPALLAIADTGGKWKCERHLDVLNRELMELGYGDARKLIVNMPYQHGKQVHDDEPVATPLGWKRHGDLRVGDFVYGLDGMPVEVQAVGEKSKQDCCVELSDGEQIRCHENHEWLVYDRSCARWRVMQTWHLEKRSLVYGENRCVIQLPSAGPLEGIETDLPIHPYALGVWLGDGQSDRPVVSYDVASGTPVIQSVEECGYPVTSSWVQKDTGVGYARFHSMKEKLAELGLLCNKHVPENYLRSTAWQRSELLAGLIDTDGNFSNGAFRFVNTNLRLIEAVEELAWSLGFKVRKRLCCSPRESSSGVVGKKDVYTSSFSAWRSLPCRLTRKNPQHLGAPERRGIVAVRRIEKGIGNCIQVDGGIYLVGKSLIPTHNSMLATRYFISWMLLTDPNVRAMIVAHEQGLADKFGGEVRDVIDRWGGRSGGVYLRKDTRAKGEWMIQGYEGGMICRGVNAAAVGRPVELIMIDDPIPSAEAAVSDAILDHQWDWFETTIIGRITNETRCGIVMTRWAKKDLCGKVLARAKITGEKWRVVKLKAIAGKDDPLGRKEGEALWPEKVSLDKLEAQRKVSRWFLANYQQEPTDAELAYFRPKGSEDGKVLPWPQYVDVGHAWAVQETGIARKIYQKTDVTRFTIVDWATSEKKTSNFTAIGTFGLCADGRVLVLEVVNKRLRMEHCVPELAGVCKRWKPLAVGAEAVGFQASMAVECRRHREIPEVTRLKPENKSKLMRAWAAIEMGENGRFILPTSGEHGTAWLEETTEQLSSFTGVADDADDIVDVFAYAALMVNRLRGYRPNAVPPEQQGPTMLAPGRIGGF